MELMGELGIGSGHSNGGTGYGASQSNGGGQAPQYSGAIDKAQPGGFGYRRIC